MPFAKGHGTGNDFVILPDPDGALPLTPAAVAALCDRRFGIGGDGLLRVVRSAAHPDAAGHAAAAPWFMDYWNADGSHGETCGNGVRTFVRYLLDSGLAGWPADGPLPVATRAGVVAVRADGPDIAVDMGRPRHLGPAVATVPGHTLAGTVVDVGNPHLVCPLPPEVPLADLDLRPLPGYDPAVFPRGANVEFLAPAAPVPGADVAVRMRVYERGVGETLSCGSGACAVASVALAGAGRTDGVVAVDLPGGRLTMTLADGSCWMSGPAVIVATGTVPLPAAPLPA
ncbi:diaminopimelate epimerase [Pilimelia terevasa]|uniref:diaminopimelate epimerase n=1 Tax=Pilimelia terevasa TaxID=53372 RepID=UPI00166BE332|nr:diaminopimelate epimerase [Pilimelia terevasa]